MINYLVIAAHEFTVSNYLKHWDSALQSDFRILHYEQLAQELRETQFLKLTGGTFIFSDLELLSNSQAIFADSLANAVNDAGFKVLNQPCASLRRFDLLKALHECGINQFDTHKVDDKPRRFPVFVRIANDHKGSRSDLLYSQESVDTRLAELRAIGLRDEDLIVTEYAHAADVNGVYRKYACFLIGDSFVPRHLLFSRNWVTKLSDNIADAALSQEEEEFIDMRPHPHEAELRRIFKTANISYGRIDYGIVNGKIQVWEINTNPVVMSVPKKVSPLRLGLQKRVANRIGEAFRMINDRRSVALTLPLCSNYSWLSGVTVISGL